METTTKRTWSRMALLGGTLALKSAKLFKALKFAKFFLTASTMALSIIAYGFAFFGWTFAIGLVLMLFIHELGHIIALKHKGLKASWPIFIPMLGAVIFAPSFGDRRTEAFVGYGGPLLGSIAALLCFGLWAIWPGHPDILLLTSYIAVFINLFNLIPVRPLDGGRVLQIVSSWVSYIGFGIILLLAVGLRDPILMVIVCFALLDLPLPRWLALTMGTLFLLVGLGLAILMTIAVSLGETSWWFVFILALAGLLIFQMISYILAAYDRTLPHLSEKKLPQETILLRTKLLWLVLYISLAITLVAVLAVQMPLMPENLR